MAIPAMSGIVNLESHYSVEDTLTRLTQLLGKNGVMVFAIIDHSGEAAKAGLSMRPTKLVIFGNPKAGTPLMQAAPTTAIDLPLKALIWQDELGKTQLSYNDPAYLQERHQFPDTLLANIAGAVGLFHKAIE
jgi:uncharacterized protein (DUF302 family)